MVGAERVHAEAGADAGGAWVHRSGPGHVWGGEAGRAPGRRREAFRRGPEEHAGGQGPVLAARDLLARHETVDAGKIGAIGYCFGGGIVLEMARAGVDLSAVASFHGSLGTASPAKAGKIKARVLVLNGAADPLVTPEHIEKFKKEMKAAGTALRFVSYPGAKHAFTNPDADAVGEKFKLPIAYNAEADKKSWEEMKAFFEASSGDEASVFGQGTYVLSCLDVRLWIVVVFQKPPSGDICLFQRQDCEPISRVMDKVLKTGVPAGSSEEGKTSQDRAGGAGRQAQEPCPASGIPDRRSPSHRACGLVV